MMHHIPIIHQSSSGDKSKLLQKGISFHDFIFLIISLIYPFTSHFASCCIELPASLMIESFRECSPTISCFRCTNGRGNARPILLVQYNTILTDGYWGQPASKRSFVRGRRRTCRIHARGRGRQTLPTSRGNFPGPASRSPVVSLALLSCARPVSVLLLPACLRNGPTLLCDATSTTVRYGSHPFLSGQ